MKRRLGVYDCQRTPSTIDDWPDARSVRPHSLNMHIRPFNLDRARSRAGLRPSGSGPQGIRRKQGLQAGEQQARRRYLESAVDEARHKVYAESCFGTPLGGGRRRGRSAKAAGIVGGRRRAHAAFEVPASLSTETSDILRPRRACLISCHGRERRSPVVINLL